MIVKVKEPQAEEIWLLRSGKILFTYLHLAADKRLTEGLLCSEAVCIAYEAVTDARGGLPLLAPMSEVAGRMSVQVAAHNLEKEQGGVAGINAARVAMGFEASVTVIDKALSRLYELDLQFGSQLQTLFSTVDTIEQEVVAADAVIGAVLVAGAAAPKLVSRAMVQRMRPGSVMVDISIDQGGSSRRAGRPRMIAPPMSRKG